MSEDKKEETEATTEETESVESTSPPEKADKSKGELSAQELAAIAEAEAKATSARLEAAKAAADKAMEEQYQATAKELKIEKVADAFTDKRSGDVIFRRELGEPEFWLDRKDRGPSRPVLSEEQEKEISRKVEIPTDQIPEYKPEHILSKEFGGVSNYESGLNVVKEEAEQKLENLKNSGASEEIIRKAEEDLKKLDYLYENYHIGMNVFRTAKGGRDKIKK